MSIRVIAGTAKGRKLKMVSGEATRPVMDRVKESLFNILGQDVRDSRWLDLFAGTGSIGIEALSRGAAFCQFLDTSREAIKVVHENLRITRLEQCAEVLRADAFAYLSQPPGIPFDVVYIAPPQYKELWLKTLSLVDQQPAWLNPDGLAVVQIDPKEHQDALLSHLTLVDMRKYGNTLLCFFERPGE